MLRNTVRHALEKGMFLLAGLSLGSALATQAGCVGCNGHYSDGERTGVVVKLSKKGWITSYEGEMHLGHSAQATTGANAWQFSVQNPEVVRQLDTAVKSGEVVRLRYREWWRKPFWIDTTYVVEGVYPTQ